MRHAGRWVGGGGGYFISKEKSNNLNNGQTNPSHYFFIGCRTAKVVMSSGDFGVTFKEDKEIFFKISKFIIVSYMIYVCTYPFIDLHPLLCL